MKCFAKLNNIYEARNLKPHNHSAIYWPKYEELGGNKLFSLRIRNLLAILYYDYNIDIVRNLATGH